MRDETIILFIALILTGVLDSPDDFQSVEDVHEAVGEVLSESLPSTNGDVAHTLCSRLYSILIGQNKPNDKQVTTTTVDRGKKLLQAPVNLSTKLKDQGVCVATL